VELPRLVELKCNGDEEYDKLHPSVLFQIVRSGCLVEGITAETIPDWCDKETVKRGQRLHLNYFYSFLVGLTTALLHGFVIRRFSEVLVLSGYSQNPKVAHQRFRQTGGAIYSWMHYDVFDPNSIARKNLRRVRAMHAMARRRAGDKFSEEEGTGIPLSQYDLGLVLMAFTSFVLFLVEFQFGLKLTDKQRSDYCHMWRLLAHFLGIDPEANIAESYSRAEDVRREFFRVVPHLTRGIAPSSSLLITTSTKGFGNFTFASYDFYCFCFLSPTFLQERRNKRTRAREQQKDERESNGENTSITYKEDNEAELDIPTVDTAWAFLPDANPKYAQKILNRWERYATNSWIRAIVNTVLRNLVWVQAAFPSVALALDRVTEWWPQKWKA